MAKKHVGLSAGAMMDQWREDGRTIGKLKLQAQWLAYRLAKLGVQPILPAGADFVPFKAQGEAKAWLDASAKIAEDYYRGQRE